MKLSKRKYLIIVCLTLLCCQKQYAQNLWIQDLADSLINETDLCINCPRLSPQITSGIFGGETVYFLRYGCDISSFFTQMRNVNGTVVGTCIVQPNDFEQCTNLSLDILTAFTFIQDARLIWTCGEGFLCDYAEENDIVDSLQILVNDEQCEVGRKELYLAGNYQDYLWEGPNQSSIESALEIDEPGLYYVTTTDAMGCSKYGELRINSIDSLTVKLFAPEIVCAGDSFSIFTHSFDSYEWSNGSTDSTITTSLPGEYSVTVSRGLACTGSSAIRVGNVEDIDIQLSSDQTTVEIGDTVRLQLTGASAEHVQLVDWSSNTNERCDDCFMTTVIPSETTSYVVNILDRNGCLSSAALTIRVNEKEIIAYAPNAVHLSGQSENSKFGIFGKASLWIEQLDVFDRWGNVMFSIRDMQLGDEAALWDGQVNNSLVEEGVYTYRSLLRNLNGTESVLIGDFMLFH